MPCYKPLTAFQTDDGSVVFAERGRIHRQLTLACGQCIGCRLERSRQWAVRCMHEAKLYRHNSFITLTYNQENLPEHGNLVKEHAVRFMKRLRTALSRKPQDYLHELHELTSSRSHGATPHTPGKAKVRFYLAGEYGSQFGRPHFHICLFGIDFARKNYLAKTPTGSKLYRSPTLEQLWKFGYSSIGELTFESAAYAARYIMKKQTGQKAKTHYEKTDPETGEIYRLTPEYNNMSRMPGIGKRWWEQFNQDWYPHGKMIVRGKETNTPRYYDKLYSKADPLGHEQLVHQRYVEGLHHAADQTDDRLRVKEVVAAAKISQLKRKL